MDPAFSPLYYTAGSMGLPQWYIDGLNPRSPLGAGMNPVGAPWEPTPPAPNPQQTPVADPYANIPPGVPLAGAQPSAPTPPTASPPQATPTVQPNTLANVMRGVVAPPPPDVQKVTHAPSLPQTKPIAGGLGDLMAMLGIAPPKTAAAPQLPATLRQALG